MSHKNNDESLEMVFSDLICGIAVIFIVLFFKCYYDNKKNNVVDNLGQLLEKIDLSDNISLRIEDRDLILVLSEKTLFQPFSYEIQESSIEELKKLVPVFLEIIVSNEKYIEEIRIEGHTAVEDGKDSFIDYAEGLLLSQKRSLVVLLYLLKFAGSDKSVLQSKMISVGYSNTVPVFNSEGQIDKEKSRRVEIKIRTKL